MINKLKKYFKSKKHFWNINIKSDKWINEFKLKKIDKIKIEHKIENWKLKCIIISDNSLYWKKATLKLISKINVKDYRPVNNKKVLYKTDFIINLDLNNVIFLDLKNYKNYSYEWNMININLFTELKVDDSLFFDTLINKKIQESLLKKPDVKKINLSQSIIDPKDNFNLIDNIKVIPTNAMFKVLWLSIIWSIIILINTFIWIHDQFVWEASTYFYSHYDSDWDSNSPLINSLLWSWILWIGIWKMMKTQLRRYMKFALNKIKFNEAIDNIYNIKDIIKWKSRVDLKNVELRIVACNIEKGQYKRWSWTTTRTVSFSEPLRAIIIYKKKIDLIPKKTDIREYLSWEFSFEEMYRTLYPEQKISNTHWIFVHWEIQLLHNKFIDQELIGDFSYFKYENFLQW